MKIRHPAHHYIPIYIILKHGIPPLKIYIQKTPYCFYLARQCNLIRKENIKRIFFTTISKHHKFHIFLKFFKKKIATRKFKEEK